MAHWQISGYSSLLMICSQVLLEISNFYIPTLLFMSLIIVTEIIECSLVDDVGKDDIDKFICDDVIPEVNSINEDEPSFYDNVPSQSKDYSTYPNAYFVCEDAFDDFWQRQATLDDLSLYELSDGKIIWKAETCNSISSLTRYLAWKVFCRFSNEKVFISTEIYQDQWGISSDRYQVDRNAICTYLK